jgi:hypothetical protein
MRLTAVKMVAAVTLAATPAAFTAVCAVNGHQANSSARSSATAVAAASAPASTPAPAPASTVSPANDPWD